MREPRIRTGPLWQFGLGRQNGLAFWGLLFIEGSFGAFMPIWPLFMEELGAPITIVGVLLGLGGIFRFFTLLPTAALARTIGGKQVLFWCRSIYTIAIAGAAFAPSWPWLLPVLIGQSVGSMAFPIILSHVSAHADDRGKVRAFSLVVTIGPSVALLIAPLISSGLICIFGLRSPFLLSALFSFLGILVLSRISDKEDLPIEEEGTEEQASYGAVLRHAPVRNVLLLKLMTVFVLGLGTALIPNYLREAGGYSDDLISLLTAFSALGTIGFGAMVVRNQRFSAAPLLGAVIAVSAVSLGFLLLLMPEVVPFVVIAFLFRG
ncbi:MAG: MFS transporter, partial [Chloroflexota bacterium]